MNSGRSQKSEDRNQKRGAWWVWIVIVGWAGVFYGLAWTGVKDRSATMDEPMHAVSAWATARTLDFRMDPDTPVLWKYWAALGQGAEALPVRLEGPAWEEALKGPGGTLGFARGAWLASGAERVDVFLGHQRWMMTWLGAALVAVTGAWAWEMGGVIAGLVAAGLVAMDPNLLGNGPLITADMAMVLVYATAAWGAWRVGRRATVGAIVLALVAAGAGPVVKFSGVVVPPVVCAVVFVRAVLGGTWWALGREYATRAGRVRVAAGFSVACAVICYGMIWGTYAFHAGPRIDEPGGLQVRASVMRDSAMLTRVMYWATRERLVPASWGGGFVTQQGSAVSWPAFLLGQHEDRGWWYYFPVVMGVKTATGTIIGAIAACWVVGRRWRALARGRTWDLVGLGVPAGVYMLCAMASHVNAGLRHVLEVYPLGYVALGVVAAWAWRNCSRGPMVMMVLGACVAAEVAAAGGNYISFFNLLGRAAGPLELAGDGNLDWGQDLKGLAEWQAGHPQVPLYVAYFGPVAPSFYGIRYLPMPGVPFYGEARARGPAGPGVMAVSGTILQGIYAPAGEKDVYTPLRKRKPVGDIGGSIFLYDTAQLSGGG